VRGIPNCKLFVGGEVVDEFTGALPERALRDWLEGALPSPAAALVGEATAMLDKGEPAAALALLDRAAAIDAGDEAMLLARVEALIALSRNDEAQAALDTLSAPARTRTRPVRDERRLAVLAARAALAAPAGTDLAQLARAAAAQPVDCEAKLAYAKALAATGDYERALAELLVVVQADRAFGDDAGRKTMLTIFEALGNDSDLARRYRRELAAAINR
jgi:putative thioredoxin